MSLKKHIRFQSLRSLNGKENLSYKKNLNDLWKHFMSSFGYKKYYNPSKNNNMISYEVINNNNERDLSIKLFLQFLDENSIEINNNNLIAKYSIGSEILSEAKIWIMFIIYVGNINNKLGVNNNIVMNIFKEGIKNGCDVISLFEFFLIYISDIKEKYFIEDFNIGNIEKILPKEFIVIYYQKKNILRNIFQKEEYEVNDNFSMRNSLKKFLINDSINNPTKFFISEEKEKKKEIHLDIEDIIVISKDYLNKGFFIIFKNRKDSEENRQNTLISYDFEEEDDDYCLMPLLIKYKNYDQKIDANNTLDLINKSIYKNYTYYPHDINIINKL
jgi:hypothetical protein